MTRMHPDALMARVHIAKTLNVSRAAVTKWSQEPTFPRPLLTTDGELYRWREVLAWLGQREIAKRNRNPDEPPGTTYADRAARNEADQGPSVSAPAALVASSKVDPTRSVDDLRGSLSTLVRGEAAPVDYVKLVMCTVVLQSQSPARWQAVRQYAPANKNPAEAQRLISRIGRATDEVLRELGQTPGIAAEVARLRPRSFEDVQEFLRRTDCLPPTVFPLLLDWYGRELPKQTVHTPESVTRLLTQLALQNHRAASITVDDPFTRSGEMLTAAAQVVNHKTTTVRGAGADASSLLVASMSLVSMGVYADLCTDEHSRRAKADVVLTNPPFNSRNARFTSREDSEWILGPPPKGNDNFGWVQICLEALKPHGVAAIVLPYNVTQSANPIEKALRHTLVEQGHLECVIALPPRLFANTPIPVCVWILRLNAKADGVLFIDASKTGQRIGRGRCTLTDDDLRLITSTYLLWRAGRAPEVSDLSAWVAKEDIHAKGDVLYPGRYLKNNVAKPEDLQTARGRLDEQGGKTYSADERVSEVLKTYDRTPPQDLEWKRLLLSDVCDIQTGPSPRPFSDAMRKPKVGAVKVVLPKHLRDHILVTPDEFMGEKEAARFAKYKIAAGDVLTIRTGSIGPIVLVREGQSGWLMNPALIRLRPKDTSRNVLDPGYLVAYLRLLAIQELLREIGVATAVPTMSSESLRHLPVALPSLAQQRRISSTLKAFDEQIAEHRQLVEAAAMTRTALAERLLTGAADNL